MSPIVVKKFDDKYVCWFKSRNQWVILDYPAMYVFKLHSKELSRNLIAKRCSRRFGTEIGESVKFVDDVVNLLENMLSGNSEYSIYTTGELKPVQFKYKYFYSFNNRHFSISFKEQWMFDSIHPLFEHISAGEDTNEAKFYLYEQESKYFITVETDRSRTWAFTDSGLLKGKLIVELLNFCYKKNEQDWIAMVHGSAVSDGESTMIFSAANGGGKSTLAALMVSKGFRFISDDVVAIGVNREMAYPFPAALSVKEGAVPLLSDYYPELLTAKDFFYPAQKRTIRYIPFRFTEEAIKSKSKVKNIVFVKYSPDTEIQINKLDTIETIQKFNTQAWIPPNEENARKYLSWISKIQAYELIYSNNDRAFEKITEILKN